MLNRFGLMFSFVTMKLKMTISVLCLILSAGLMNGQTQKTTKDSIEHHILLIPYDPRFYLSDADRDIAEVTRKNPDLIRETFHNRSEWFTWRELKHHYPTVSLLQHDSLEAYVEAAGSIFAVTAFEYAKPTVKSFSSNSPNQSKESLDSRVATNYLNNDEHNRYMKADIRNKSVLDSLANKFGTDIFVFLTQFEIKTNYKSCLDIANQVYEREIRLHFTIYDRKGKLINGNYAVATIPSNVNQMDEIILKCFTQLAQGVASAL
jgi:hypothetical protein